MDKPGGGLPGREELIRHDIYGGPTWSDFWDAAKGPGAAMLVAFIGVALCPESAGANCAVAVGAASGFTGQCATDCSDRTILVLTTLAGAATAGAFAKAGDLFDSMAACNSFTGDTRTDGGWKRRVDSRRSRRR